MYGLAGGNLTTFISQRDAFTFSPSALPETPPFVPMVRSFVIPPDTAGGSALGAFHGVCARARAERAWNMPHVSSRLVSFALRHNKTRGEKSRCVRPSAPSGGSRGRVVPGGGASP